MTDRLILPMINVCVACLREGIVEDADVTDGAMIFGTGFAPFRGGPLHYAKTRGVPSIVAMLGNLASRYGNRFKPDAGWDAISNKS
jgi:3-hydroxyacyl-CoA dehydrogenase/enoyl-CoA hydratase/3-hydroxybutyryl-CoA epimerase